MKSKEDVIKLTAKLYKMMDKLSQKVKVPSMRDRIMEVQLHTEGYAEPGYANPECGIIATGNWNTINFRSEEFIDDRDDTIKKLEKVLEAYGVEMEWNDEWAPCDCCEKLVRISPSGYDWSPSYWLTEGELICIECLKENREGVTEGYVEWLTSDSTRAMTGSLKDAVNLADYGYVELQGKFQNGMHYGMDADPKKIGKKLEEMGVERFIFVIDEVSQFYMNFSVWVHEEEAKRAYASIGIGGKLADKDVNGPSVAGRLEANLKEATKAMGELAQKDKDANGKIKYAKVSPDGYEARLVTREEFIKGIK
jgi:hypothetical protein